MSYNSGDEYIATLYWSFVTTQLEKRCHKDSKALRTTKKVLEELKP